MKCPSCGYTYSPEIKVCSRMIASGKNKESVRSSKKATEKKRYVYDRIKKLVMKDNNKGKRISVNTLIKTFGILGYTEGDTIRITLDKLVCEGILTKIKFNCRTGHKYVINEKINTCGYFAVGSMFPVCLAPQNEFKSIGEYKE